MFQLRRNRKQKNASTTSPRAMRGRRPEASAWQALENLESRTMLSSGPVTRTWVNPFTGKTVTSSCYMCQYLDPMMPDSAATNVAIKSGNWSDPSTWQNGRSPATTPTS